MGIHEDYAPPPVFPGFVSHRLNVVEVVAKSERRPWFRVWGVGFRVPGSGCGFEGFWFQVSG